MNKSDKTWLIELADAIKNAERKGQETDVPEGNRWIVISDTLANIIEQKLRKIAGEPIKSPGTPIND
jgi:hypothetical protein